MSVLCAQNRNYRSLRALYDKYRETGFNLIAFPCNQFGGQAPETSDGERQIAFKVCVHSDSVTVA